MFPSRPRKLKLEFYDADGVKHSISIDGPVSREKVGKILDLVEVLSGSPQSTASALAFSPHKFDRLASLVIAQLKGNEFTSKEAQQAFEKSYGERVPLSTISTYLSRLSDRGILERGKGTPMVHYRVMLEERPQVRSLRPASSQTP